MEKPRLRFAFLYVVTQILAGFLRGIGETLWNERQEIKELLDDELDEFIV